MARFVLRRCLQTIPTLLLISVVVFTLIRLAPGDPAEMRMGRSASLTDAKPKLEALRREMGLDKPLPVQYLIWLRDCLRGNFGNSIKNDQPATQLIAAKVPVTLELVAGALALGLTTVEKMRLTKRYTENTEAYRAFGFASAIGILPPNENWPRSEAAANNALALSVANENVRFL